MTYEVLGLKGEPLLDLTDSTKVASVRPPAAKA